MASIHVRADTGEIRVRWRNRGERHARSQQVPSEAVGLRLVKKIHAAAALGEPWPPAAAVGLPALSALLDAYLLDLRRLGRADRTIERAHAVARPFLVWLGDERAVDALTLDLLERYDRHMVERGNGVSARRVAMWALGGAWRWGWRRAEWRAGMSEPMTPVMPRVSRSRPQAATWEQLDEVVALAADGPEWRRRAVLLLRGTGWRIAQVTGLDWSDLRIQRGELVLRPELGKSGAEKAGRVVPIAPWLLAEILTWEPAKRRAGPLVPDAPMRDVHGRVRALWEATDTPPAVYVRRPDHAFRIGLISGLTRARVDVEAVEYYVGHAAPGVRGHYVDPASLPLDEVAAAIPRPCVRGVSDGSVASIEQARHKRASRGSGG